MKKLSEILKTHKYTIVWTLCYIATIWAVLKFLFDFDMFSARYWSYLVHAKLHGFAGFVFGILILAALPLYIASTTLIIRTKKPLFTIPIPAFIKNIWSNIQPTLVNPPEPAETQETKKETKESTADTLPDELPSELRTAYIRARSNMTPDQRSAFNQPNISTPVTNEQNTLTPAPEIEEIPLPTDFNFEPMPNTDFDSGPVSEITAPTFTEITFDNKSDNSTQNPIADYLNSIEKHFDTIDEVIITDKHAIASHTDDDFWVCDEEFWFATGKQIKSPISQLQKVATTHKLTPVLYLGSNNIMDIDTMRKKWESMNITIISNPDEIPE